MKRIGSPVFLNPLGVQGQYVPVPDGATHFLISTYPIPAVEAPPPAGLVRAAVEVWLLHCKGAPYTFAGGLIAAEIIGAYDLGDCPEEAACLGLDLHGAAGILVTNGAAAGCTAVASGRVQFVRLGD
jgi:hypothetical protein